MRNVRTSRFLSRNKSVHHPQTKDTLCRRIYRQRRLWKTSTDMLWCTCHIRNHTDLHASISEMCEMCRRVNASWMYTATTYPEQFPWSQLLMKLQLWTGSDADRMSGGGRWQAENDGRRGATEPWDKRREEGEKAWASEASSEHSNAQHCPRDMAC